MKNNYISSKKKHTIDSDYFKKQLMRNFRNCVGTLLLTATPAATLFAQTNPVPQQVPYTQNFDSLNGTANSLPIGWGGWKLDGNLTTSFTGDAIADATFTIGTNNSSTAGLYDMIGKLGFFSANANRTTPVLAISTLDRQLISINYDINVQRVNSNRGFIIKLQYRLGNTGEFHDLDDSAFEYIGAGTGTNVGTGVAAIQTQSISVDLPAQLWFQPEVQLRWITARTVNNQGTGENHSFSIDNVSVNGITDPCANGELPYHLDFTGETTTSIPNCTRVDNLNNDAGTWKVVTSTLTGFTPPFIRYNYNTTNDANDWFYTKGLALETGQNYRLRYKMSTGDYDEKLKITFGNMQTPEAMTNVIFDHGAFRLNNIPTEFTQYFTVPRSGNYYIGFNAYSIKNQLNINLDDIIVDIAPTCFPPTGLSQTQNTVNSVSFSWATPSLGTSDSYEYYYSTDSTTPTAATAASGTSNTTNATINNLATNENYYVWVRTACSATDKSEWSNKLNTRTANTTYAFPFNDDFSTKKWALENFNSVNKFHIGTPATSNQISFNSGALFVSNTESNDIAYNYTLADPNKSNAYAFVDVTLPENTNQVRLKFDWLAKGESTFDYGRFFIVPTTYNPDGSIDFDKDKTIENKIYEFNNNPFKTANQNLINRLFLTTTGTWTPTGTFDANKTTYDDIFDLSGHAGQTVRLLFIWRNDVSGGTQPPLAIDNFSLDFAPSCIKPLDIISTGTTDTTATISWTASVTEPTNGYEYYVSSTEDVSPLATVTPTGSATGNTTTVTNLNALTTYKVWVRSVCSSTDKSDWSNYGTFTTQQTPAQYPYIDNFDTEQWIYENGTQTNKFYTGTPTTANDITYANNKLFVSNNGLANSYATTASSVYAYRDITLPADITYAQISFDWILKGQGTATGNPADYGRFYIIPTSITPAAGTNLGYGEIPNAIYSIQNHQTETGRRQDLLFNPANNYSGAYEDISHHFVDNQVNLTAYAGQTVRLVFFFRNDTTAYVPSLAIDNFSIKNIPNCLAPTELTTTNITNSTATVSWTASISEPANGYEYYFSNENTNPSVETAATGNTTQSSISFSDLNSDTNYYIWVRSVCSTSLKSEWSRVYSFSTEIDPRPFPFIDDFSTLKWKIVNNNALNKFKVGTPTGTSITFDSEALFVTNNDSDYAYTATDANKSNVYAYTDIVLPNDITKAKIQFDWLAKGESTFDYGRFFIVPTSYRINPNTDFTSTTTIDNKIYEFGNNPYKTTNKNLINRLFLTTSGTWTPTGSFLENKTTYVDELVDLAAYAGQTVRLLFIWRNDISGGAQPPLVIDNFSFETTTTCIDPTDLTISNITDHTASINWTGNSEQFTYAFSTTNVLPNNTFTTTNSLVNLDNLNQNTTYYVWVKSNCNLSENAWVQSTFRTAKSPSQFPLTDNFDNDFNWNILNLEGATTNKFKIGIPSSTEISFENPALFITNNTDNNSYAYSHIASQVFAYTDVLIPSDISTTTEVAFDWFAKGESTYDYGRFFIVPTSYNPIPGTVIAATTDITGQTFGSTKLNLSTNTGTSFDIVKENLRNTQIDLTQYAGQAVRLVFYWRNDASGGTQIPLAIDNFYFGPVRNLNTSELTKGEFTFYPNPVKDVLNFNSDNTITTISVYNLAGQNIDHIKVNQSNYILNTTKLNAGIYIVKVDFENGTSKTIKIIKK